MPIFTLFSRQIKYDDDMLVSRGDWVSTGSTNVIHTTRSVEAWLQQERV